MRGRARDRLMRVLRQFAVEPAHPFHEVDRAATVPAGVGWLIGHGVYLPYR